MGKVLVVDDAAFQRMRMTKLLQDNGHDVVEAGNGQEAVVRFGEEKPSLVLMDITMPIMDGIEATAAIKEQDPDANIVMVSALGQQSMVMAAVKAGARDFIVKPYQPQQVMDLVSRYVVGG